LKSNFPTFKWLIQLFKRKINAIKWLVNHPKPCTILQSNQHIEEIEVTTCEQILAFTAHYSEHHNSPTFFYYQKQQVIKLFITCLFIQLSWLDKHTLSFFLSLKLPATFSLYKMTTTFVHNRSQHSGHRSTPDRMSRSSDFSTSVQSTTSSSSSGSRNPVVAAAMSVAGLFAACFTPPDANHSKSVIDSEEFKSTSTSGSCFDFFLIFLNNNLVKISYCFCFL